MKKLILRGYPQYKSKRNIKGETKLLQERMNSMMNSHLACDDDFGPATLSLLKRLQIKYVPGSKGSGVFGPATAKAMNIEVIEEKSPVPAPKPQDKNEPVPWYLYALQFKGKRETDPKFAAFMVPKWKLVGLNLKTIATSWSAWCGLAIAVVLSGVGIQHATDGARAKNWGKYGEAVEWKQDGIPQGAIIHINPKDCKSSKGNHVTLANGFCTASDLLKSGATFDGYGGNQNNQFKVSTYSVKSICAVRWPKDPKHPKPGKVLKSVNCTSKRSTNESTR